MSPSFIVAMFLALVLVAYWRITLAVLVAVMLAGLLVGTGIVDLEPPQGSTTTTLQPVEPVPPVNAAGGNEEDRPGG